MPLPVTFVGISYPGIPGTRGTRVPGYAFAAAPSNVAPSGTKPLFVGKNYFCKATNARCRRQVSNFGPISDKSQG
eukprot:2784190-Rhodomonas_salina.1